MIVFRAFPRKKLRRTLEMVSPENKIGIQKLFLKNHGKRQIYQNGKFLGRFRSNEISRSRSIGKQVTLLRNSHNAEKSKG